MNEMIQFAYAPDIVMDTVKKMQEWDPAWELPDEFFPKGVSGVGNGTAETSGQA